MNNLDNLVLKEVLEGMHVVIVSPIFKKIFYLYKQEGHTMTFQIQVATPENVSHNSYMFTDLFFRSRIRTVLPTGKLRMYQTKEEAESCVALWTHILFQQEEE